MTRKRSARSRVANIDAYAEITSQIDAKVSECSTLRSVDPAADVSSQVDEVLRLSEDQTDEARLTTLDRIYPYASSAQLGSAKRFYVCSADDSERTDQQAEQDRRMTKLLTTLRDDTQHRLWDTFWVTDRSRFFGHYREQFEVYDRGNLAETVEIDPHIFFEAALQALTLRKEMEEVAAVTTGISGLHLKEGSEV